MKRTVVIFLVFSLLSTACTNHHSIETDEILEGETTSQTSLSELQVELVYKDQPIVINPTQGYLGTSLEKNTELTPYFTPDEVDNYLAYPVIHIVGDHTYVARVFPKKLEGSGKGAYNAYNMGEESMKNEIEVYQSFDFTAEPEIISLPALNEQDTIIYGISANIDGTYTVNGYQKEKNGNYQHYLYIFDADGNLLQKSKAKLDTDKITIYYPYGDSLYYIQQNSLKREQPMKNTTDVVDANVIAFTRQGNELYYVCSKLDEDFNARRSLWVYNLVTGEKSEVASLNTGRQMDSIAYDAENQVLYFSDYTYIYAHPLALQGDIKVAASYKSNITLLDAGNGSLSLINRNYQVAMYNLPESPVSMNRDRINLRICVADMEKGQFEQNNRDLLMAMEVNGIAVTVEETYIGASITSDEYVNTMAKKLMSGDTDFDLFYVSTRMSQLFKEGYYENLTNYPVLNHYFTQMRNGVEGLCSIGETWALVPFDLTPVMAVVDTALTDGKTAEIPGTLDELLPHMDQLTESLRKNDAWFIRKSYIRRAVDMWFEQYIANFMAKTVDDDTARADLVELYDMTMKIVSHPAVSIDPKATEINGRTDGGYFSQIRNFGVNSGLKDTEICAAVPKINPSYRDSFAGTFYAINPNSENKELAALFLAYFLENQKEGARFYESETNHKNDAAEKLYTEQMENGIRMYELNGWELYLNDRLEELQNGSTPDEAAEITFRYLKQVRDE